MKVKKPLFLVNRTAEWYTDYGNQCEDSSIRQTCHVPAIPFLGIYAKDSMFSYRDIYSSVLSLFTKAKDGIRLYVHLLMDNENMVNKYKVKFTRYYLG